MAGVLPSKDITELSHNLTTSFNLNETHLFLHGISVEEDAVDRELKKVLRQIEHRKELLVQEKHANLMLSIDRDHLQHSKIQ